MNKADEDSARHKDRWDIPARWPVAAPLVLVAVALCLRMIDIFVLRLDDRLGEIILSKSLGFALVVGYTLWVGQRLSAIGLHARNRGAALAIGAGLTLTAFTIASVFQVLTISPGQPLIQRDEDPGTGMTGGMTIALFLIIGNAINVLMEERLFLGIMPPHFLQRMRFARANLLQAALFSIWHLVWPVKAWLSGDASAASALAQAGVLLSGAFIAGLVFGYLFWRTGSLWAPMLANFLNNVLNGLLQIQGTDGTLQPAVALSVVVVVALVPLTLAVGPIARSLGLPGLHPTWGVSVQ